MDAEELDFLEQQLAATELLFCGRCEAQTLHAHLEVLATYEKTTELLMQCTYCGATQSCVLTA